ncbi:hypothetical protein MNBD_ALPHA06-687, partial [hydrothermal vent metagenome]
MLVRWILPMRSILAPAICIIISK